jgi:hypothetical protein
VYEALSYEYHALFLAEGARSSLYLLYWYKSTNTDAEGAAAATCRWKRRAWRGLMRDGRSYVALSY